MTKYLEVGSGNTWLMRTEFEDDDGTEYEVKGGALSSLSRIILDFNLKDKFGMFEVF